MKSSKLPSGSYRVQKQIKGQRLSMTFDHKPTKNEIEAEIAHRLGYYNGKLTFEAAMNNYIDARTNILSPATIRGYRGIVKAISPELLSRPLDEITNNDINREINKASGEVSPKTVKNRCTFISSVFAEFRPDYRLRLNIPMQVKKEPYIPTDEEVTMLLAAAEGTRYKTALLLAACGFRRGEICALTMDDIDFQEDTIFINKDIVLNDKNEWVVKAPKTTKSIRKVKVNHEIIECIKQNGLYHGCPSTITHWMNEKQKQLGINQFSIHKLRHYFVSTGHAKGIADAAIMYVGGWSTPGVMIKDYRHAKDVDTVIDTVLEDII